MLRASRYPLACAWASSVLVALAALSLWAGCAAPLPEVLPPPVPVAPDAVFQGRGGRPVAKTETLPVLFVGNSYTYTHDIPKIVEAFAREAGIPLRQETVVEGGATLEKLLASGYATQAIREQSWRYVVIQEHSTRPIDEPQAFFRDARVLAAQVKARGARPVYYLTWARKDAPATQIALTDAYRIAARDNGGLLSPVGNAWRAVRAVQPPIDLYQEDGRHPNELGAYLSALVLYRTLTGRGVDELPARVTDANGAPIVDLTARPEVVRALKRAASEVAP